MRVFCRGMSLSDAFNMMDTESAGQLTRCHMYAGFRALGINISISDFLRIWVHIPKDAIEDTSAEPDFIRAFTYAETHAEESNILADLPRVWQEAEANAEMARQQNFLPPANDGPGALLPQLSNYLASGTSYFGTSRLNRVTAILTEAEIRELAGEDAKGVEKHDKLDSLDIKIYERLKFRIQPHSAFKKVWEGYFKGTVPTGVCVYGWKLIMHSK